MRIGIITELSDDVINFGNCLQAFALNYLVRSLLENAQVETIKVCPAMSNTLRTKRLPINVFLSKVWVRAIRKIRKRADFPQRAMRKSIFVHFAADKIPQCKTEMKYENFADQDYDAYIVGSDVVWSQYRYGINRVKFLDFQGKKPFKRIAYAASFARDWIPEENKSAIYRCLKEFDAISVREKSSIQMLRSLGIEECVHVLDPVLLFETQEWEKLEIKPEEMKEEKYVFIYLLGEDIYQYQQIEKLCHQEKIKMVTIPYASGITTKMEYDFGDIQLWTCSPQNWLWLVHHAEYVITDSFHGLAFSVIFNQKFIALERAKSNINNRLTDFLNTIRQGDKQLQIDKISLWKELSWNYTEINQIIEEKRKFSIEYLKKALQLTNDL
ncbi:MAG: polysaccharide pyruvyl transferase family protein [Lachnospiraceae bacterium]|nr:polysaccharide pyruvyl transferase family protein [Lachnospiraceae bacterium]